MEKVENEKNCEKREKRKNVKNTRACAQKRDHIEKRVRKHEQKQQNA